MYTREESSRIRQEFWTTFGKYMGPVLSAESMKINWINYHTGVKDVYFRMEAGANSGVISISIEHSDADIRELYFEQFLELKNMLHLSLEEEWEWEQHHLTPEGKVVSRIFKAIEDVSVFDKDQWSDLISFFKPRIIALDSFWENGKYSFEGLR